jgi:hypothetical protein
MTENLTSNEPYLLVEEVAERLGLPLSVLIHRVEAGDIPATRVDRDDGPHYALRLSDLGIEDEPSLSPDDSESSSSEEKPGAEGWESAIVSAFNSRSEQVRVEPVATLDVTGHRVEHEQPAAGVADTAALESGTESLAAGASEPRPREPQNPPEWLIGGFDDGAEPADADVEANLLPHRESSRPISEQPGAAEPLDAEAGATAPHVDEPDVEPALEDATFDEPAIMDSDVADNPAAGTAGLTIPPPPARAPQLGVLDAAVSTPRGDLAAMSLDARELVAGLLDRWERTLEQRIYTEQRQRFHGELMARQNMVKQLQMELHTARAEHAAAQAEKDRILAEKERELADRERDLADTRRVAEEAERLAPSARRRRWFWSRDD